MGTSRIQPFLWGRRAMSYLAKKIPIDKDGKNGPRVHASKTGSHRRILTAEYKLGILRKAEKVKEAKQESVAGFLKKEGLYPSHLTEWKKQIAQGLLGMRKRGRPRKGQEDLNQEIHILRQR